MDADGGDSRVLTGALDRTVESPIWAPDGRTIYVDYTDRGVTKIARVSLDGRVEAVAGGLADSEFDRPYSGGGFSAGGGVIAYAGGTPDRPADLFVLRRGQPARLTALNEGLLGAKTLAHTEPLPVASTFDHK